MAKLNAGTRAEFLALQQLAFNDVANFKRQQWHITNYGLAVYAALVAVVKLVDKCPMWADAIVIVIATATAFAGGFLVWDTGRAIGRGRERLFRARKPQDELTRIAFDPTDPEVLKDPKDKLDLTWFFWAVLAIGFCITISLIIAL